MSLSLYINTIISNNNKNFVVSDIIKPNWSRIYLSTTEYIIVLFLRDEQITHKYYYFSGKYTNYIEIGFLLKWTDQIYKSIYNSIEKQMVRCKKYAIIPCTCGYGKYMECGHMIVVFYLKNVNKFYIFDSSGYTITNTEFKSTFKYLFGNYEYITNAYKLQAKESKITLELDEVGGYCVVWSCLFIHLYRKFHKSHSFDEIVEKILLLNDLELRQLVRSFGYNILKHIL